MKNRYFLVLALSFLLCVMSFGQAVVSVETNNFLFRGVNTPISIAVPNVESSKVIVTTTDGILKKIDNVRYTFNPTKNYQAVINIKQVLNEDTINVSKQTFKVLQIPLPEITICDLEISTGNIQTVPRNSIISNPVFKLSYNIPNFITVTGIEKSSITSFSISYKNGTDFLNKKIVGCKIPHEILMELRKSPENTKITVDNFFIDGENSYLQGSFILE